MPTYRPSCRVRLQIRLDEGADTAALQANLEKSLPEGASFGLNATATRLGREQALSSNFQQRQQLGQNKANMSAGQFAADKSLLDAARNKIQFEGTGEVQEKPVSLQDSTEDDRNVIFNILPKTVKISRMGLKDASTCRLSFDLSDMPVDPRSIRAVLVSVAIGTVDADDYAAGILDQKTRDIDGSLRSLVERNPGQELSFSSTTKFVGFADEWRSQFTQDDGDLIELDCRDLSSLFRDERLPAGITVDMNLPLADGIQQLVNTFPSIRNFQVFFGTPLDSADPLRGDFDLVKRGPIPAKSMPKTAKSRKGTRAKAKRAGTNKMKVWDHVVQVVQKLGYVPVIRGFSLFLLEPRTLFQNVAFGRKMVYGINLSHLEFARKLAGDSATPPTIEVRCPDPSIGRTRWARHPVLENEPDTGILGVTDPVITRANKISPNGTGSETVQIHQVRGINDTEVLKRIAQNLFEEIGRQEIEGNFKTDDLDSFESARESDLLDLQSGDPVTILVAPPAEVSSPGTAPLVSSKPNDTATNLQLLAQMSVAKRIDFLKGKGFSEETAKRLAIVQEQIPLANTFRANNVNIDWDNEDGVTIEADFFNYIVIREAEEETPPEAAGRTPAEIAAAAGSL